MSRDFDIKIPDGLPNIRPRKALTLIVPLILIGFGILVALDGHTYLMPEEVAVIKNNLTGAEEVRTDSGLILHLPLGLTDVYKLDRTVQSFDMKAEGSDNNRSSASSRFNRSRRRAPASPASDNVTVKVQDGSNVELDVSIQYQIIPDDAAKIIKNIGAGGEGDAFRTKLVRAFTRALIREKFGTLTLDEISDPATRTVQNQEVMRALNTAIAQFGLEVQLVNTTNFRFNSEYEKLVKQKKATAQEFTNQAAAQENARKDQEVQVARATREKETALIAAQGEARKRIVEADNRAKQLRLRAAGDAYAKKKDGDRSLAVATAEAQAIEAEGLNTAAGIKRLAEAYARGGIALVKETLAKKLAGRRINGRPYSLSEDVSRLKVEHGAAATGATSKGGGAR